VALLICGVNDSFRRFGVATLATVPMYDTCAEALVAAEQARSRQRRVVATAPLSNAGPQVARELIADACDQWGLADLRTSAVLIISELVTNAIRHARTEAVVEAALRDNYLHLRVRDWSATPPAMTKWVPADGFEENVADHGRGLHIIEAYSTAWGFVLNPGTSGKLVWATLRARPIGSTSDHGAGASPADPGRG
jgi:anti-sigma regulatory factor (Ser/Thr protein kinase)